jgi:hypothetical protein
MRLKSKLIIGLFLISSFSSMASDSVSGRLSLRDGRNIVRIEIGDDKDDRQLLRRVRDLEMAVRDLQNQIYQLQDRPVARTFHICTGKFFSIGSIDGDAKETYSLALSDLMKKCERAGGGIFCKEEKATCETIQR